MIVVHIEEEYGYRDWLWETDMSPEEVKEFWRSIKTVNEFFFSGPTSFPGTVTQVYIQRTYKEGWQIHETPTEGRERVYYLMISEDGESTANISMPEKVWSAHIHMECDSWLKPFDEDPVYHAGHVSEEEYFSEDYEPSPEAAAASLAATEAYLAEIMAHAREHEE